MLFQFSKNPQLNTTGIEIDTKDKIWFIYIATLCEPQCKVTKNFKTDEIKDLVGGNWKKNNFDEIAMKICDKNS